MSNDDDFLLKVLGERDVEKVITDEYKENFDSIIDSGDAAAERAWQSFELTQRENVNEWIEDPKKIKKIQPNLEDLVRFIKLLPKPIKIADIGCYGGYVYDYLIKVAKLDLNDFEYVGVDIQEDAIEAAKLVHKDKPNARFQVGDIYELNKTFKNNEFDVVICSRVLIHIPYFKKAVKNLTDISKYFTLCVLEISEQPLLQKIHRHVLDNDLELDYFFRKYSEEELIETAEELNVQYRIIKGPSFYSSYCLLKDID